MSLRSGVWLGLGFLTLLLAACAGIQFPLEAAFHLAVGWAAYLQRVLPAIVIDRAGAATAVITLLGLVLGMHAWLRWLSAQTAREGAVAVPRWRWRWTFALALLVILLFVSGIALTGVAHQTAWLATSPDPALDHWWIGGRTRSKNHLKSIGLALHSHHDQQSMFPAGAIFDSRDEPLHGWQTQLLPMLDEQPLFQRIDRNVPWNSERNREPFQAEVPVFLNPQLGSVRRIAPGTSRHPAVSHYAGNAWVLQDRPLRIDDIRDGTGNTFFAGEVVAEFAPWGQPMNVRDPRHGINKSPHGFGSPFQGGCHLLMGDGSVRFVSETISSRALEAGATPAGGEPLEPGEL